MEDKILNLASGLSRERGLEIVEVKYSKSGNRGLLNVYIHKDGGVSVKDCTEFSRTLEVLIEAEGLIKDTYVLEVSSPGLNRLLVSEQDYIRNIGSLIKVKFKGSQSKPMSFTGTLDEVKGTNICLSNNDESKIVDLDSVITAKPEVCF